VLRANLQTATAKVASILLFALAVMLAHSAGAQSFTVLHSFTNGGDGATPVAGVTLDGSGNIYGTASQGGFTGDGCTFGCGTVFRMKPSGSRWILDVLYSFHGQDGWNPSARVVFGPDGTLYGTTAYGGTYGGANGTVFNLRPSPAVCKSALCPWQETVLWSFMGHPDGATPGGGDLTFDAAGHLYGTTISGGLYGYDGTVFELAHLPVGDWSENIDYSFGEDIQVGGYGPYASVIFDQAGNMYTTTFSGGPDDCGTVDELVNSASGWTETVLHALQCGSEGEWPYGGLIFDQAGNLYGTTAYEGSGNGGTVFELTPSIGNWIFNLLYSLSGGGPGPLTSLTMDGQGNLYGTTKGAGVYEAGNVFKLTFSNGDWTYTDLHDFTGGADGGVPFSQVTLDSRGNLYGTASQGGANTYGVVWEITP
jgi:uncharacterized repeat protein (TIGR03803 family)